MNISTLMENPVFKRGFDMGFSYKLIYDYFDEELHPRDEKGQFTSGEGGGDRQETYRERKEREKYEKVREVTDRKNAALDSNNREEFLKVLKECHETEGYETRDFVEWEEKNYPNEERGGAKEIERNAKAFAILTNLSSNELRELYPYCEGRSDKELEGYFDTVDVWDVPENMSEEHYDSVACRGYAMKSGCEWDEVGKLDHPPVEREIIGRLGFKDKDGYCASLAQAYLLNKGGYDVTDRKDEHSRAFFACFSVGKLADYAHEERLKGNLSGRDVINFLKDKMESGKEYFFSVATHASVARLNNRGEPEFLELQENKWDNGWKKITEQNLGIRYGLDKADYTRAALIDGKDLTDNPEFVREAGYFNSKKKK